MNIKLSRRIEGAVWVEFLVSSSALFISLFILIPLLAKYMDIKQNSENAGRYALWERTVWYNQAEPSRNKSDVLLENEATYRVFSHSDTLITSSQAASSSASVDQSEMNSFHFFLDRSSNGSSNYSSLLGSRSSSTNFLQINDSNNAQISFSEFSDSTKVAEDMTQDMNGLVNGNGYFKNSTSLLVKTPFWLKGLNGVDLFDTPTLSMSTNKAILVDGWGVGDIGYNEKQVNKLRPVGLSDLLDGIQDLIEPVVVADKKLSGFDFTNDLGMLDFGHVNTEEVLKPNDQLGDKY